MNYFRFMIKMKEALRIMERTNARGLPLPFSVVFCTADLSRNTGGEIIEIPKAVLSRKLKKPSSYSGVNSKNQPSHHRNRTRNIQQLNTSEIRKLHIDLILFINGEAVA